MVKTDLASDRSALMPPSSFKWLFLLVQVDAKSCALSTFGGFPAFFSRNCDLNSSTDVKLIVSSVLMTSRGSATPLLGRRYLEFLPNC